ncbi:MAG: hypothetical protein IJ124_12590 [Clostridia bacterium]|nr:hypothetical protein [Clostridia bacterium]
MKKTLLLIAICLALFSTCMAETARAEDFFSGLSNAWNSFVSTAENAVNNVSDWVSSGGITQWADQAGKDISQWADQASKDVTQWANQAGQNISQWVQGSPTVESWYKQSGIPEWVEQNRPAVEAWIAGAGEDISRAWNTVVNPSGHTQAEIESARKVIQDAMDKAHSVWTPVQTPVQVTYERMWEESAHGETRDAAVIAALVDAIKALTVGERTDMAVDDYTDILTFTFADGTMFRLEFEGDIWVGAERRQVEGLKNVRAVLDGIIQAE